MSSASYVLIASLAVAAAAAWLLGRAVLRALQRFVRNLWPH
jgi:hypothetical protein